MILAQNKKQGQLLSKRDKPYELIMHCPNSYLKYQCPNKVLLWPVKWSTNISPLSRGHKQKNVCARPMICYNSRKHRKEDHLLIRLMWCVELSTTQRGSRPRGPFFFQLTPTPRVVKKIHNFAHCLRLYHTHITLHTMGGNLALN